MRTLLPLKILESDYKIQFFLERIQFERLIINDWKKTQPKSLASVPAV